MAGRLLEQLVDAGLVTEDQARTSGGGDPHLPSGQLVQNLVAAGLDERGPDLRTLQFDDAVERANVLLLGVLLGVLLDVLLLGNLANVVVHGVLGDVVLDKSCHRSYARADQETVSNRHAGALE